MICSSGMRFNPHPSRRTGATESRATRRTRASMFQSSPVPKDGCNRGATSAGTPEVCFNPHPSRRTGATSNDFVGRRSASFQSSPVPKDGCNAAVQQQLEMGWMVSILTRPEGRVQLHHTATFHLYSESFNPHPSRRTGATRPHAGQSTILLVSILTRPEGRVQRDYWGITKASEMSFNPHPSRRTGATRSFAIPVRSCCSFQSSPVPKDGCN